MNKVAFIIRDIELDAELLETQAQIEGAIRDKIRLLPSFKFGNHVHFFYHGEDFFHNKITVRLIGEQIDLN